MTENYEVMYVHMYDEPVKGGSIVSGNLVTIVGEQRVSYDGEIYDQYLYDIDGYTAQNGKHFAALKANICVL